MHSLRRYKLQHLLETRFKGDRGKFLQESGLTKGRLSQLLDPEEPFGEVAARRLEERLTLEPGYFDKMDRRTVEWAVMFDGLPDHLKDKWVELARLVGAPPLSLDASAEGEEH